MFFPYSMYLVKIMRVILNGMMIATGSKCKQCGIKSQGIITKSGTITSLFTLTKLCWDMHQHLRSDRILLSIPF